MSYAYLNTLLESIKPVVFQQPFVGVPTSAVGEPLTFSPKNKIVLTPTYTLPIDPDHGQVAIGATYVLQSSQNVTTGSPYGSIGGYGLLNLNLNWTSVERAPVDLSFFATNVLNRKYVVFVPGVYDGLGFEPRQLGEPQMFGARLRYRFGL